MNKYYYTIGEVCNLLELKAHVLRYWEKEFPQVKPRKRLGRNRRYTQEDIELLKKIKHMLYVQRLTIEGARKKLQSEKKQPDQMELDFSTDKHEMKKKIIRELIEIKKILKSHEDI